jgi:excisionase family DNA binding protein
MDRLLTPKQLGEKLQVKLSTVYKWVHYGYVPHIKLGDLTRFDESSVESWVKQRSKKGRPSYSIKDFKSNT